MKLIPFRRYIHSLALVVMIVGLRVFQSGPVGAQEAAATVRSGAVLVKFKPGVAMASEAELAARYGATVERTVANGVRLLRVPDGWERAVSRALAADSSVLFAEPDALWAAVGIPRIAVRSAPVMEPTSPEATPSDPFYDRQWGHTRIRSGSAWDLTTGDADVTIAVIDTGIDSAHPDLAIKVVSGHSFLNQGAHEDSNPVDLNGHGTHIAGIAAAVTDNSTGVAGMSWGARIMPIRVLGRNGTGWTSDIASGIVWAYQNGADVINLSLGSASDSQTVRDAIDAAHNAGALLVAAMGNEASDNLFYPAAHPDTLAVSATDFYDDLAYYSNYGSNCDVAAPGGELVIGDFTLGIYSTLPTNEAFYLHEAYGYASTYDYLQGTSQATPFVAGLAALIWSIDGTLTADQVQQVIEETTVDLSPQGKDPFFGHGRIDARAALDLVNLPDTPVLSPISNPEDDGTYLIDWNDVDRAVSYVLEEDDHPDFDSPTIIANTPASSFNVQNQVPGSWSYRVRAINESGSGPWSNVVSTGVVPPAPMLNGIQTLEPDAYQLSWSSAFGAQTYRLTEADNLSFTGAITRYLGASLAYTITGQNAGIWYYRVTAGGEAGYSDASHVISTTAVADPVPVPNIDPIDNEDEDGDYAVSWSEVLTATTYILEESSRAYFDAPVEVYRGGLLTYTVAAQPIGRWHYRVRAVTSGDQKSPWSAAAFALVPDFIYLPIVMR